MGSLTLNGATSGQITLNPPAVAGTNTLSLPAQTATIITDSSAVLNIGSGQLYKDASGNVGIGTTSPGAKLQVVGTGQFGGTGTDGQVQYLRSSDGAAVGSMGFISATTEVKLNNAVSGPMTFFTNNTERARIDASGNLLVGTTTQATGALVTVNGSIQGTITRGTSQASTSGTSITFTGIPSWARRITMMLQGVSTSSTSQKLFQLGTASGFVTTGYLSSGGLASSQSNYTQGFGFNSASGTDVVHGTVTFVNLTSNTWVATGTFGQSQSAQLMWCAGSISSANLGGVLTQVRMTTANGTDTFTAGNINILYEG